MPVTVFVVDDHTLVRQAIVQLLNSEGDLRVVGEGTGTSETLAAIQRARPQVVLIDLEMPGLRGAECIKLLKSAPRSPRILVCTMHGSHTYVSEALRCGADGYVLKSSPGAELVEGIHRVAAGQGHLDPALQSDVIKLLQQPARAGSTTDLTRNEVEVLRLAAEGLSNHEIAVRSQQSVEMVKLHLRRTFQKLGAADRAHAVALGLRRNLI